MKNRDKHKNPFKTPDGYFDSLEDQIMQTAKSPLSSISKEEVFKTPDNYFENFEVRLPEKIDVKKETKVIGLGAYKKHIYTISAIAAVIAVIILLQIPKATTLSFDDIASNDIEEYYINNKNFNFSALEMANELELASNDIDDINYNETDLEEYLEYHMENSDELNLDE